MIEWTAENWKIITGLAFFLLAIHSMEGSVAEMSGRKFKLFLKRETGNTLKAATTSALITSVLQSSSLVNLVVMDMLGSGIISLRNALALNLGANLGTTVNSWLVVWLGFNTNLENWIFPLTGITGILMSLLPKTSSLRSASRFLFSLSLLLFSLDMIKTGSRSLITHASLQAIDGPLLFLLFGLAVTVLVQASSIVMVLALTALYAGTIGFSAACAVILGGEIGTTLKFFIASRGSSNVKKRMALGNFLFNLVAVLLVFLLLEPICRMVLQTTGDQNQLIALVLFQTAFNIFSLLLFLPWLTGITRFLSRMFSAEDNAGRYIKASVPAEAATALSDLENETRRLIWCTAIFMMDVFDHKVNIDAANKDHEEFLDKPTDQKYIAIKQLHGQMQRYGIHVRKIAVEANMLLRLDQLTASMRNCLYAAKSIHNIETDVDQLRNSSKDMKYGFFRDLSLQVPAFCQPLVALIDTQEKSNDQNLDRLTSIFNAMSEGYKQSTRSLYANNPDDEISDIEITTMINTNREIYSSFKSLFYGVMEFLLSPADTDRFDQQPGFIR